MHAESKIAVKVYVTMFPFPVYHPVKGHFRKVTNCYNDLKTVI